MLKLAHYIRLVSEMETMEEKQRIFRFSSAYGNIAYFIEIYSDLPDFPQMMNEIEFYIRTGDRNNLCWILYRWIMDAMKTHVDMNDSAEVLKMQCLESLDSFKRDSYDKGNFYNFGILDDSYFPEWFFKYYKLKAEADGYRESKTDKSMEEGYEKKV